MFGANGEKDKRLQSNTLQLDSASSTRLTLRFDGRERTAWGWSVEAANGWGKGWRARGLVATFLTLGEPPSNDSFPSFFFFLEEKGKKNKNPTNRHVYENTFSFAKTFFTYL